MIFREKRTFKIFWHLFKHDPFTHFGDFWQYTNWFVNMFCTFWVLFHGVLHLPFLTVMDRKRKWNLQKYQNFPFILVEISVFFVALLLFRLFSSLRISSFSTFLNKKWDLELQNFLIASILGWFRYPTIAITLFTMGFFDLCSHGGGGYKEPPSKSPKLKMIYQWNFPHRNMYPFPPFNCSLHVSLHIIVYPLQIIWIRHIALVYQK